MIYMIIIYITLIEFGGFYTVFNLYWKRIYLIAAKHRVWAEEQKYKGSKNQLTGLIDLMVCFEQVILVSSGQCAYYIFFCLVSKNVKL